MTSGRGTVATQVGHRDAPSTVGASRGRKRPDATWGGTLCLHEDLDRCVSCCLSACAYLGVFPRGHTYLKAGPRGR
jgi:hypothetical protein